MIATVVLSFGIGFAFVRVVSLTACLSALAIIAACRGQLLLFGGE